jgi:nucleotide-binding universal stress UspA family protein
MSFEWHPLLLSTEHGEFDAGAERVAFHLAQQLRVRLAAVLPYLSNEEIAEASPELAARTDEEAGDRADAVEAAAAAAGVDLRLEVRSGPELHTEIVDEAVRVGARLIVTRRRGKVGFLKRLQVGEMVGQLVAHAPCSVLMVPRLVGPWQRGVMVVAEGASVAPGHPKPLPTPSAGSERSGRGGSSAAQLHAAAQAAARMAGTSVHVFDASAGPHQNAAEAIVAAARDAGCDLIVIARHARDASASSWIGGVAHKVVGLAECAVLVHAPPAV